MAARSALGWQPCQSLADQFAIDTVVNQTGTLGPTPTLASSRVDTSFNTVTIGHLIQRGGSGTGLVVNGTLTVEGNTTLNGSSTSNGPSTFASGLTVSSGPSSFVGASTFTGSVAFPGGVTGNTQFAGTPNFASGLTVPNGVVTTLGTAVAPGGQNAGLIISGPMQVGYYTNPVDCIVSGDLNVGATGMVGTPARLVVYGKMTIGDAVTPSGADIFGTTAFKTGGISILAPYANQTTINAGNNSATIDIANLTVTSVVMVTLAGPPDDSLNRVWPVCAAGSLLISANDTATADVLVNYVVVQL